jgi:hypothetical protein
MHVLENPRFDQVIKERRGTSKPERTNVDETVVLCVALLEHDLIRRSNEPGGGFAEVNLLKG